MDQSWISLQPTKCSAYPLFAPYPETPMIWKSDGHNLQQHEYRRLLRGCLGVAHSNGQPDCGVVLFDITSDSYEAHVTSRRQ